MPLSEKDRDWYCNQIEKLDPEKEIVTIDRTNDLLTYNDSIRCDESRQRRVTAEEVVRALALCILIKVHKYEIDNLYIEKYYQHGHPSSKRDEVDLVIFDNDDLPFAMWEFKSSDDFDARQQEYIQYQLFGTAPLVGAPRLLVYATIVPMGETPNPTLLCIDYSKYQSYDSWLKSDTPHSKTFPEA